MPDIELAMDDGYAVLVGGAAAACAKPFERTRDAPVRAVSIETVLSSNS